MAVIILTIPSIKLPPNADILLPYLANIGIDRKLPTNCAILAINGAYTDKLAL
jgi:hypothetical protein